MTQAYRHPCKRSRIARTLPRRSQLEVDRVRVDSLPGELAAFCGRCCGNKQ